MMAARIFNKKQALEKEIKELYLRGSFAYVTATATSDLTADIAWTSVASGPARNTNTITIEVEAAAANPTDTVLAVFTGTAAAIVITITPNDGTNNGAVAVDLTSEELVELVNSGAVVGKDITLTDAGSLRALQTATGGDETVLVEAGEGDGVVATFSGGDVDVTFSSKYGFSDVVRTAAGEYRVDLQDEFYSLKSVKAILIKSSGEDIRFQLKSQALSSNTFTIFSLTGATATDPSNGSSFMLRADLKNTRQV